MLDRQKFYGKALNESQAVFWRSQLANVHEDDLIAGVINMKLKEPTNWLPACNTVKRYAMDAMETRLNQEKARAPTWNELERSARTPVGREAIALMQALSQKRITRADYIAKMRQLGQRAPGWGRCANELEAWWASEPTRHEIGKSVLETIWKLQEDQS